MCTAVWRTLRGSTLESSTLPKAGTQRPLWQRVYADVLLALLGVLTYGLYTYLTSIGILDAPTQVLLAGPSMLAEATLLCLAGALLFLRAFPWLVRLGVKVAITGCRLSLGMGSPATCEGTELGAGVDLRHGGHAGHGLWPAHGCSGFTIAGPYQRFVHTHHGRRRPFRERRAGPLLVAERASSAHGNSACIGRRR